VLTSTRDRKRRSGRSGRTRRRQRTPRPGSCPHRVGGPARPRTCRPHLVVGEHAGQPDEALALAGVHHRRVERVPELVRSREPGAVGEHGAGRPRRAGVVGLAGRDEAAFRVVAHPRARAVDDLRHRASAAEAGRPCTSVRGVVVRAFPPAPALPSARPEPAQRPSRGRYARSLNRSRGTTTHHAAPPARSTSSRRSRPPSGTTYRWDANQAPGSRPQNLSFRTKIGEGFSDATPPARPPHRPRLPGPQPRRHRHDHAALTAPSSTRATSSRCPATCRHAQHRRHATGWMAHAKDRMFQEIYVDRDAGPVGRHALERKAALPSPASAIGDFSYRRRRAAWLRAPEPGARRADDSPRRGIRRRRGARSAGSAIAASHQPSPPAGATFAFTGDRPRTSDATRRRSTTRSARVRSRPPRGGTSCFRSTATGAATPAAGASIRSSQSSPSTATTA
jgi:hypothetical protein